MIPAGRHLGMHPAEGGRLILRCTSEAVIFAGVVHLPVAVRPDADSFQSAWTCHVDTGEGQPRLLVASLPHPEEATAAAQGLSDHDLCSAVTSPVWRRYAGNAGLFDARFVRAFAGNCWTMVGLLPDPALAAGRARAHQWFDIGSEGRLLPIDPPVAQAAEGMALRSLLRDLCVWPDRSGRLHTLAANTPQVAWQRNVGTLLRVLAARGDLSPRGVKTIERNLPELATLARGISHEIAGYRDYLTEMADRGALRPELPMTKEELTIHEATADAVVQHLLSIEEGEFVQPTVAPSGGRG